MADAKSKLQPDTPLLSADPLLSSEPSNSSAVVGYLVAFAMTLSSLATGTVVRAGIYPALSSRFDFWPVATTVGQLAVIGLAFDPDERPAAPDTAVDTVKSVMALAPDRQHSPVSRNARSES